MTMQSSSDVSGSPRTTNVFDWKQVEPAFLRKLLLSYGTDIDRPPSASDLRKLSDDEVVATAAHNMGRPPRKEVFQGESVIDLLRRSWLPQQSATTVGEVVNTLSIGIYRQAPGNKIERLQYLAKLNRTKTLSFALRKAFIGRYKTEQQVRRQIVSIGEQKASGVIMLRGAGAAGLVLYDHQVRALEALNSWVKKRPSGGVIVLPTGAGKTATAATWLLDWLAAGANRKVLWLAHQRELVDQAARSFEQLARSQSAVFECHLRLIHGAGSAISTLTEPRLRIALATMQSVRPNSGRHIEALQRFADGPTIVVVDEAHRASSATYRELLDVLQAQPKVRVLGLTATPTPSGAVARRRFRERFPRTLLSVDPGELVRQGILARPVFHKIDTHVSIVMSSAEVRRSLAVDVPDSVLKQLSLPVRNQLIVDTWKADEDKWGKTLVFATSIQHAEQLTRALVAANANARAIHSRSPHPPGGTLDWFRSFNGNAVLVSVGMLTEGVDLPRAQTAFLARPTTSAVLMRQMVGRVLRGPKANGTALANLVTLHDDWANFTGVIEPIDLKNLPEGQPNATRAATAVKHFKLITIEGKPIPSGVLAQIQRLYSDHAAVAAQGAQISRADLIGYYDLAETRVPVFRHQADSFAALIRDVVDGVSLQGKPATTYFADDPLPHPTQKSLVELVDVIRDTGDSPTLTMCEVLITPDATAGRINSARSLTPSQRNKLLREGWEQGGFLSYQTFDHWHEAVDARARELSRRRENQGTVCDPEVVIKPISAQRVLRDLGPLFDETVLRARDLLDSADTRARLHRLPSVAWSRRRLTTAHAHWRPKRNGPAITVSCSLEVSSKHVSDELLRYLLWHELLHHVLPGHGHDAEFRHIEGRWPAALDLDRELDTLHERIGP